MKKFLYILSILITLFLVSCSKETTNEPNIPRIPNEDEKTVVYVTNTGEKYHEYGCQYLNYSCVEKELQKAIDEGYTPCSICIAQ